MTAVNKVQKKTTASKGIKIATVKKEQPNLAGKAKNEPLPPPKFETQFVTVKVEPSNAYSTDRIFTEMRRQGYDLVMQLNTTAFTRDMIFLFEKRKSIHELLEAILEKEK